MSGIYLTLGGKERTLRFSFLSLKALEQHYGKPIGKVFADNLKEGEMMLSDITTFLWACLRKEKLSVAKIEELIDESIENEELTIEELAQAIQKAVAESKVAKAQTKGDEEGKN